MCLVRKSAVFPEMLIPSLNLFLSKYRNVRPDLNNQIEVSTIKYQNCGLDERFRIFEQNIVKKINDRTQNLVLIYFNDIKS